MKNKIVLAAVGVILSISLLVTSSVLAEEKIINLTTAIALIAVSSVLVLIAVLYASKIDYETGIYECRKCGHTFKPTFKAYIMGAHTLRTRSLKCPECNKKSWCLRKSVYNQNSSNLF